VRAKKLNSPPLWSISTLEHNVNKVAMTDTTFSLAV